MKKNNRNREKVVCAGLVANGGIAIGQAIKLDKTRISYSKYRIHDQQVDTEINRFKQAILTAKKDIESLKKKMGRVDGQEQLTILDSHLLMVSDQSIVKDTMDRIREDKMNAEWAYEQTVSQFERHLSQVEDKYFRDRGADVRAATERVLACLTGKTVTPKLALHGMIVVAKELTPVDTIEISKTRPLAFVTELGGKAGHVAIIARSLSIPCLVGVDRITDYIQDGDEAIIDGEKGCVFISPSSDTKHQYKSEISRQRKQQTLLLRRARKKAVTKDRVAIHIAANAEWVDDIDQIKSYGAEGIGLFRTEYLFLGQDTLPDEETQYNHYKKILQAFPTHTVTIRTLDVGGDKFLDPAYIPELNPALGVRGIRYCFKEKKVFYTQLRALMRASIHGKLRLLFSMVNSLEEIFKIKQILIRVKRDLEEAHQPFDANVPLGIMVETPAAALTMDLFCAEVDFFSIGTNDLTQYTLAVDRDNDEVSRLYDPLHPGHVRLLKHIVETAKVYHKPLSICGELAGDPYYLYFILGLGLKELSMNAVSIPRVKYLLGYMSYNAAQQFVQHLLSLRTAKELNRALESELSRLYPDWFQAKSHSFSYLAS